MSNIFKFLLSLFLIMGASTFACMREIEASVLCITALGVLILSMDFGDSNNNGGKFA